MTFVYKQVHSLKVHCVFQTLTSVNLEPIVAVSLLHVPILPDLIYVLVTRVTLVMAGTAQVYVYALLSRLSSLFYRSMYTDCKTGLDSAIKLTPISTPENKHGIGPDRNKTEPAHGLSVPIFCSNLNLLSYDKELK